VQNPWRATDCSSSDLVSKLRLTWRLQQYIMLTAYVGVLCLFCVRCWMLLPWLTTFT